MKQLTLIALFLALMLTACNPEEIIGRLHDKRDNDKDPIDDKERVECFKFVYPISYTMPNGDIIEGDSEDAVNRAIRAWYEEHPDYRGGHTLNYPVKIIFWDGMEMVVNSDEEMAKAKQRCCKKDNDKERPQPPCFKMVFPVTYIMPNGDEITARTPEQLDIALKEWYENHPDYEREHSIKYPVTLIFWDGVRITVNSDEEMARAKQRCKKMRDCDKDNDKKRDKDRDRDEDPNDEDEENDR